MYCTNCSNKKPLKLKKLAAYSYTDSGLENITLNGVMECRCPNCGEVSRSFGNIDQLNSAIIDILLAKKDLLSGKEIRFLRSSIGYSGKYFSEVLGVKPETLSRIETQKNRVTISLDRHIRSAVFNKVPNRNYDLHDRIISNPIDVKGKIRLAVSRNTWRYVAGNGQALAQ